MKNLALGGANTLSSCDASCVELAMKKGDTPGHLGWKPDQDVLAEWLAFSLNHRAQSRIVRP